MSDLELGPEALAAHAADLASHAELSAEEREVGEAGAILLGADRLREAIEFFEVAQEVAAAEDLAAQEERRREIEHEDARREIEAEGELDRRREEYFDRRGHF